jgi:mRNA interferase RelE/StbE
MASITFTDDALDDLRRIGPDAVPKVLKKILLLADDAEAGYPLGGDLTGFRKLVVGRNTWRIVYRITADKTIEVCEIWAIGARADAEVYREATMRLQRASETKSHLVALAQVVDKLGKLAGDLVLEQAPPREPVPDWLAARLVHTAGMAREEVAALDLQQAVDLWTEYMSRPQG